MTEEANQKPGTEAPVPLTRWVPNTPIFGSRIREVVPIPGGGATLHLITRKGVLPLDVSAEYVARHDPKEGKFYVEIDGEATYLSITDMKRQYHRYYEPKPPRTGKKVTQSELGEAEKRLEELFVDRARAESGRRQSEEQRIEETLYKRLAEVKVLLQEVVGGEDTVGRMASVEGAIDRILKRLDQIGAFESGWRKGHDNRLTAAEQGLDALRRKIALDMEKRLKGHEGTLSEVQSRHDYLAASLAESDARITAHNDVLGEVRRWREDTDAILKGLERRVDKNPDRAEWDQFAGRVEDRVVARMKDDELAVPKLAARVEGLQEGMARIEAARADAEEALWARFHRLCDEDRRDVEYRIDGEINALRGHLGLPRIRFEGREGKEPGGRLRTTEGARDVSTPAKDPGAATAAVDAAEGVTVFMGKGAPEVEHMIPDAEHRPRVVPTTVPAGHVLDFVPPTTAYEPRNVEIPASGYVDENGTQHVHSSARAIQHTFTVDAEGNPFGGISQGHGFSVKWQRGPVTPERGRNGAFIEELLTACIERLRDYQGGRFACIENEDAIRLLEAGRAALFARTADRAQRGVEGTHEV